MKTVLIKTLTKKVTKIALVLIPAMTLSMTATAHDPSMHVKKATKADCSKMDHSKMDMKDPVAMAMMTKCIKQAEKSSDKMNENMDHSKMKSMDEKMDHNKMNKMDDKNMKKDNHNNH